MTLLKESITVQRPVADCYRYLLDFSTIEQWDPGVYRAEKITPGLPAVGTRFDLLLNTPGGHTPMQYELTVVEPLKRLELRGEGAQFSAHDCIQFEALDAHTTQITYQAELQFDGPLGHMEGLLGPWLNRLGRKAVHGMAGAFEDPAPPFAPPLSERLRTRLLAPAMLNFTQRGYLKMPHKGLTQDLSNKTILITGPTSGLGLAAACELARLGARTVLIGRDAVRLQKAAQSVIDFSGCSADRVSCYAAELSSLAALRDLGEQLLREEPVIDVLINNAGALFNERSETPDGFERSLAINLLAPYLLTQALLPRLRESKGRVINVASGGLYTQGLKLRDMGFSQETYDGPKAYARCKRALLGLTEYWAKQAENNGVLFSTMHPGWAATPGVAKSLPAFNQRLQGRLRDSRMGADTICWLASSQAFTARHNGLFWFDRKPQPTAVLPGTAHSPRQIRELLEWLELTTKKP